MSCIIFSFRYVAGRLNIISATEAKGLNTFVGTFSLPSLIFMSMATLDLSSVNWEFLLAILLAKSSVFLVVLVITLLVTRPVDMSKSGLLAIFCTQSNDFALGYPIVAALYSQSHPAYPSYLYLMAPISLVILNPIAFLFMELGKRRAEMMSLALNPMNDSSDSNRQKPESTSYLILSILVKVLFNPVVFMTTLGIVGNLVFHQQLPIVLEGILKVCKNHNSFCIYSNCIYFENVIRCSVLPSLQPHSSFWDYEWLVKCTSFRVPIS